MIRRLLCWLGFHEWEFFDAEVWGSRVRNKQFCVHCGKVKK